MVTTPVPKTAVERVHAELRHMLLVGELGPGQELRQTALAERLGVSRIPVREALKSLQAEGLVDYRENAGYSVVRLESSDLAQIYTMRRTLESELLGREIHPTKRDLKDLRKLNAGIEVAARAVDIPEMVRLNRLFHFQMFGLTGLNRIVDEVSRLWDMATPYQALYLCDATARDVVVADHEEMVSALETHERERLVGVMDHHRKSSESWVDQIISLRSRRSGLSTT